MNDINNSKQRLRETRRWNQRQCVLRTSTCRGSAGPEHSGVCKHEKVVEKQLMLMLEHDSQVERLQQTGLPTEFILRSELTEPGGIPGHVHLHVFRAQRYDSVHASAFKRRAETSGRPGVTGNSTFKRDLLSLESHL